MSLTHVHLLCLSSIYPARNPCRLYSERLHSSYSQYQIKSKVIGQCIELMYSNNIQDEIQCVGNIQITIKPPLNNAAYHNLMFGHTFVKLLICQALTPNVSDTPDLIYLVLLLHTVMYNQKRMDYF